MYFDAKAVGERIRQLRKSEKLTQEGLAEKLNTSADHIGKIENTRKGISIDLMIDLADFFDVSLDYLILGRKIQNDMAKENLTDIIHELETLRSQL